MIICGITALITRANMNSCSHLCFESKSVEGELSPFTNTAFSDSKHTCFKTMFQNKKGMVLISTVEVEKFRFSTSVKFAN